MSDPITPQSRFFDSVTPRARWLILILVGLMPFGNYFAYDSIGALSTMIIEGMGVDREAIGLLYSFYSWPNVIMVLIGGIMIDRFGTRIMSLVFSGFIVLGAAIVAAAPNLTVMILGRTVFGIGAESLIVCQSAILAKWFKGRELALSFGISLTIMRIGTALSFNTEAAIANSYGSWRVALWVAAGFCVLSFVANIFYVMLERMAREKVKLAEAPAGDKIVFSDVKKFTSSFWFIALLCVTFYSAIFPFTGLAVDFFHDKWSLSEVSAGRMTSIIIIMSAILAPIIGRTVDKIGRRGKLLMVGTLLMIPSHALMGLLDMNPVYSMVVLGFSFSLVSAVLWPAVPLIVEEKAVGTAFGLITMIQNIGLAAFPWFNGMLRDATTGYTASQLMFASLGLFGFIFALLLMRSDRLRGGILERTRTKIIEAEVSEEEEAESGIKTGFDSEPPEVT